MAQLKPFLCREIDADRNNDIYPISYQHLNQCDDGFIVLASLRLLSPVVRTDVRLLGGRPVFSDVSERTPEEVFARYGLELGRSSF